MVFFGFPTESNKAQGFFGFSPETEQENQKKPCVFLVFHLKSQKNHVIFWISVGKSKNPRKTKKSKSFGPLRKVLDFWFFGFFVSAEGTTKPKIQKIQNPSEGPETFGFFGFPRVFFGFPTKINKKNTWCFLVFQQKSKKTQGFWGFSPETEQENQKKHCVFFGFPPKIQKNHVIFWISVGKPKKP